MGLAWASYDMAYRRQAANRGSLDWVTVDAALYNEVFAGWAKLMSRCRYCLADTHYSQDCVHAPSGVEILPSSVPRIVDSPPGRAARGQLPARVSRFAAYSMHLVVHDAGSTNVVMHMCAQSAGIHTQPRSVARGTSRPHPTSQVRVPRSPLPLQQPRAEAGPAEAELAIETTHVVA